MTLHPTTGLLDSLYWITLVAVVFSSASGVLKAGLKQFDLFGVIIIAVATGLGGGSLRDMLLDREVFWIRDQMFFVASLGSALLIFIGARLVRISDRLFLIPDAAGLAAFGVAGTLVSLMVGAPWLVASFMGVMTGTMGGIFRDVLSNEPPVVFQSPLYATVCWSRFAVVHRAVVRGHGGNLVGGGCGRGNLRCAPACDPLRDQSAAVPLQVMSGVR